jgi:acetylornithine/LysW-gamma-L-lysine aminotransferase
MGALSATWEKTYREPFEPLIDGVTFVPFNNAERLRAALTPDTAAVLIEVVQGEGGVHPAAPGYLSSVQAACRANGTLLIVDEVQTGFGRTGTLFAHHADGIEPDIMTCAKSIGGGIPMGAALMSRALGALPPASHGSTFGGNPLACAAGLAVLDTLRAEGLPERSRILGEAGRAWLRERLSADAYRDIRGRGLMTGIELRGKVAPVLRALQERGVLALPAGPTVLRLLPPLTIEKGDYFSALDTVAEVLNHAI